MGHIKKIEGIYYIEFYARGLLYAQAAGNDKTLAQRMLQEIEGKIASGEALTVERNIPLMIFFQQFLEFAKAEYSPVSVNRFAALITHLKDFLTSTHPNLTYLSQLSPVVIEQYKALWIERTSTTKINLSILLLREIMEYGIKAGFINDNPTLHVCLLPGKERAYKKTFRYELAMDLLRRSVPPGKAAKLMKLTDIGKIVYFANLIPLKREEMYN